MCSCPSKLEGRVSHAFVPPAGKQHAEPRVLLIPGKETKHHGARQFKGCAGPLHHRTRAFWPFGQMGENTFSALGGRYCGRWIMQKFLHLFAWRGQPEVIQNLASGNCSDGFRSCLTRFQGV